MCKINLFYDIYIVSIPAEYVALDSVFTTETQGASNGNEITYWTTMNAIVLYTD